MRMVLALGFYRGCAAEERLKVPYFS